MLHTALTRLSATPADIAPEPSNLVVVITGLSLVFFILVVLVVIMLMQGKIFGALDKRKAQNQPPEPAAPLAAAAPAAGGASPAPAAAVAPAAPVVQAGIAPEVVAAIMAAIHAQTGGSATPRAIFVAKPSASGWRLAGALQTTEPF